MADDPLALTNAFRYISAFSGLERPFVVGIFFVVVITGGDPDDADGLELLLNGVGALAGNLVDFPSQRVPLIDFVVLG